MIWELVSLRWSDTETTDDMAVDDADISRTSLLVGPKWFVDVLVAGVDERRRDHSYTTLADST